MMANRSGCFLFLLLTAGSLSGADQKDKKPAVYKINLPAKPDFSALDWAIGEWAGHTDSKNPNEGEGTLHLVLSYVLDSRFVSISEEISLPARESSPVVRESWSGYISPSPSRQGFTLQAFSSTGFITEYHVTATPTELRFDPEGGANPPPGWLFRRVISRLAPDYFEETVDVAPPGSSFFNYYSGKLTAVLKQQTAPVKAPPPAAANPSSSTPPPPAKP